jgi:UDP-N-acetylmuramyl pentapeptide phosphotransferase/UDP-N-acetylglucosamine-1-phosphate transferase
VTIERFPLPEIALVGLSAVVVSAALIFALKPLLMQHALARPNARSSHVTPTPQGGGIAVIAAVLVVAVPAAFHLQPFAGVSPSQLWPLFGAIAFLAAVGTVDDIKTIDVLPRLVLQVIAVTIVITALPHDIRVAPFVPLWLERICLALVGVWAVNLVNFMDGIDWITVAEVVPVTAGVAILSLLGILPPLCLLIALALLGAIVGFAPFNRPVASLFLGDVGSLPIGLILFWLLVQLAGRGYATAAVLLPLYYLADATITLLWRMAKGQPFLQAHRSHYYQCATERGYSVPAVIARVAAVNAALVALAVISVLTSSFLVDIATLALGSAAVVWLLSAFSRGKR